VRRMVEDAATGEATKVVTGFTTATVFDVRQTEGIPLPHGPTPQDLAQTEAERSLELDVALRRFVDERGVRVVADRDGMQRGYWHPGKREIGIRADLSGVRALKTLAHEAAHMLADHRRERIDMADAETVAESVAFVLLDHYGIDTSAYSVPYIATWARDPGVVSRNLDTVRTLSHVMLTAFGDACLPAEDGGEEGAR
jgi:antirestriction protein ArdC